MVYILPEEWQKMPESEKLNYSKNGICICENGEGFIVAMRDSGRGLWISSNQYPTKEQAILIKKYIEGLNNVLLIFGGEALEYDVYWTSSNQNGGVVFSTKPSWIGFYFSHH